MVVFTLGRRSRFPVTTVLFTISSLISSAFAGVGKLKESATDKDLRYRPAVDFDTDSCYSVSAVDANGNFPSGLDPNTGNTADCRDSTDLKASNT